MRLVLYTQYYRARTPERQAELDHCLRSNLQHPLLDQVVLLREPDAPDLPGPARMPVKEVVEAERLTYAVWMRMLRQEEDAIGILINSDIALGRGWEHLEAVLNTPESVVALSRYNPQGSGEPARLKSLLKNPPKSAKMGQLPSPDARSPGAQRLPVLLRVD